MSNADDNKPSVTSEAQGAPSEHDTPTSQEQRPEPDNVAPPLHPGADDMNQTGKPEAQSASPERDATAPQDRRPEDPESADDVMNRRQPGHEEADAAVLAASRTHTRRSFVLAAAGAAAGYGLWHLVERPSPSDDDLPVVLRRALQTNASLSRDLTHDHALSPTYPLSKAENLSVNGVAGLKKMLVMESYRMQLVGARDAQPNHPRYAADVTQWKYRFMTPASEQEQGHDTKTDPAKAKKAAPSGSGKPEPMPGAPSNTAEKMTSAPKVEDAMKKMASNHDDDDDDNERGKEEAGESDSTLKPGTPGLLLTIDDVTRFPRHEFVTQFKCIEGWSRYVHWAGVRLADFMEAYPPAKIGGRDPRYVYMETPNGDYYVGYDLAVCRHPQTLLVTEMMGQPLTQTHGAPVRIHMPIKYGYKQIKCVGLMAYMDEKPDDYWTKLGYDWYAGL